MDSPFSRYAVIIACIWLAGCQALLPKGSEATQVPWRSFAEARDAIEAIEPFRTRTSALTDNGFDPFHNPAVTILTWPEIVQRFAAGSALRPEEYERGIRECLLAGKRCGGYAVNVERTRHDRIGNFWLDLFGFVRRTNVTGWTFEATILYIDDEVVYTVYGGQPGVHRLEVRRNPLGPLQSIGDAVRVR